MEDAEDRPRKLGDDSVGKNRRRDGAVANRGLHRADTVPAEMDDAEQTLDAIEGRKRVDPIRQLEGQDVRRADGDRLGGFRTGEELALERAHYSPGEAGHPQMFLERGCETHHAPLQLRPQLRPCARGAPARDRRREADRDGYCACIDVLTANGLDEVQ
jgi:hypothetical protein